MSSDLNLTTSNGNITMKSSNLHNMNKNMLFSPERNDGLGPSDIMESRDYAAPAGGQININNKHGALSSKNM